MRKVLVQLDYYLGGQFAGLTSGLARGAFAARGLDVRVAPPCAPGGEGDASDARALLGDLEGATAVQSRQEGQLRAERAGNQEAKAQRCALQAALRGLEDLQRTFQEREDREHALRQQQA